MLEITHGNLLNASVDALVNTVNTEGVMGKGIALQFKQAYPQMYRAYEAACKANEVQLGRVHVYDLGGLVGGPRWIVNFPTKGHWRSKSHIEDISNGLDDLIAKIQELGIRSIAVPPLGCGYGGLSWTEVEPLIAHAFESLPDLDVKLYPPSGTPDTSTMPIRTERPKMTPGRAALIGVIKRYQQGLFDPFISLLEVHKLMYFLQEVGQPLNLKYEPKEYGPYAKNLRQVFIKLDGHFIQGYGAGADEPMRQIELKDGAYEEAEVALRNDRELVDRINKVSNLIEGFEDPYGLELLSSIHWVMRHDPVAAESADAAINAVHQWNQRKSETLKSAHLKNAWERVREHTMEFALLNNQEFA